MRTKYQIAKERREIFLLCGVRLPTKRQQFNQDTKNTLARLIITHSDILSKQWQNEYKKESDFDSDFDADVWQKYLNHYKNEQLKSKFNIPYIDKEDFSERVFKCYARNFRPNNSYYDGIHKCISQIVSEFAVYKMIQFLLSIR